MASAQPPMTPAEQARNLEKIAAVLVDTADELEVWADDGGTPDADYLRNRSSVLRELGGAAAMLADVVEDAG